MDKIALVGDSIFDNKAYVAPNQAVIDKIKSLSENKKQGSHILDESCYWSPNAVLLAVDGAITEDVANQCKSVTEDIDCLILSIGGNDALAHASLFYEGATVLVDCLDVPTDIKDQFQASYQKMLKDVLKLNRPVVVCTIYNSCPTIEKPLLTALSVFNDVIFAEAFKLGAPVLDLRSIFNSPADYSSISPIEPSETGGEKLALAIKRVMESLDFIKKETVIYS